jgi:transcriptional regulator with XRE-family HTH domain
MPSILVNKLNKPERLATKLAHIRKALNLSQNGMIQALGLSGEIIREEISTFERGMRVPPVLVLLAYARACGVFVDVLIDDSLDLPDRLPCYPTSEGVKVKRKESRVKRS